MGTENINKLLDGWKNDAKLQKALATCESKADYLKAIKGVGYDLDEQDIANVGFGPEDVRALTDEELEEVCGGMHKSLAMHKICQNGKCMYYQTPKFTRL